MVKARQAAGSAPSIALFIDANHLVRRNYFMLSVKKGLSTSKGSSSGALYGSLRTLRRLATDLNPAQIALFFDGGHVAATKLLPEYKQTKNRNTDESFYVQCGAFEEIGRALGLPCFNVFGVEADTLIGIASKDCHYKVIYIISSDHDFYQLISSRIRVHDDLHGNTIDMREFRKRFPGLQPRDMIAVKALAGDVSDNIPGVPQIGEGTAIEVVRKMGGLKGMLHVLNGLSPFPSSEGFDKRIAWRVARGFEDVNEARKIVRRNYKLVRIPRKRDLLSVRYRAAYEKQLETAPPDANLKLVEEIAKKFELASVLHQFPLWAKPLLNKGGRLLQ